MNVLLIVNYYKDSNFSVSKDVIEYLESKNINIYSDDKVMIDNFNLLYLDESKLDNIDFSIIIGGDGTILKYASKYSICKFPFIGINLGRVGALTLLEKGNYKKYIDKIINGDFYVVEQLGLSCNIHFNNTNEDVNFIGYNDIILHRGSSLKLLPIITSINHSKKNKFYADGLIVATPNGSSAYNASAGGPLLSSDSNCYVITPICSQVKYFTPLVVSNNDIIKISLSEKADIGEQEVTISADGCYKYFVSPFDKITIEKSKNGLKMIHFNKKNSIYRSTYKVASSLERGKKNG